MPQVVTQWDAQGRPYYDFGDGQKRYVPPATAAESDDPRLKMWAASQGASLQNGQLNSGAPGQSLLKNRGEWNPATGQYDQGTNYGNLLSIVAGGLIAAPLVAGAVGAGAGAASSTAAGAGSGAATGGGMTFGQALLGLAGGKTAGLANASLQLAGAAIGANAAKSAASTQSAAADKALGVQQQAYNQQTQQFAPYLAAGQSAIGRLGSMAAAGPPPFQQRPPMNVGQLGSSQPSPQATTGQMVTLKGPDGSIRQVPAATADQFIQRGAVRVG